MGKVNNYIHFDDQDRVVSVTTSDGHSFGWEYKLGVGLIRASFHSDAQDTGNATEFLTVDGLPPGPVQDIFAAKTRSRVNTLRRNGLRGFGYIPANR